MFKHYFKIFLRNLWKHSGYSASNIIGLAVGMVTCILILLLVKYEFNWNTSNEKIDRISIIQQRVYFKNSKEVYLQSGYALAQELKNSVPEIEEAIVMQEIWSEYLTSSDTPPFHEEKGFYAHSDIFKVFTYKLLRGDPAKALNEPYSIVLSKEYADKYFLGQDAYGKMIKSSQNKYLKVTGVYEDLPLNNDVRPVYLVSFSTMKEVTGWKDFDDLSNIDNPAFRTFVLLKSGIAVQEVNPKIVNFLDKYKLNNIKKLHLKPLSELHISGNEMPDTEIALVNIAGIAVFVLILASINFINLSTANSNLRKKEIGVRKVVGASRLSLFKQFIGESLTYTFIAMFLAFMLVELLLPAFNTIVQRQLSLNYIRDAGFIWTMISIFAITGFLSGVYPALFLSSFQPVDVIKGNLFLILKKRKERTKSYSRRFLVGFQFFISVSLLIGTIYVSNQVNYMKNKDLGFNRNNMFMCKVYGEFPENNFETLRSELISNPSIEDVSFSVNAPFNGNWSKEINWEGSNPNEKLGMCFNSVSYNYLETFGMKIVSGRNFSRAYPTDNQACLINETAAKRLGWKDPVGKLIDSSRYTIIGVVKDFHQYSVHAPIPAFYMTLKSSGLKDGGMFAVRIKPGSRKYTAGFINNKFKSFFPDAILDIKDFNEDLDIGTKGVWEIVDNIFTTFSIIALLLAANGLFGLVSFAAQRRVKEIGIRKVLGAGSPGLFVMMSKEYLVILLISVILAFPVGYIMSTGMPGAYKYQMHFTDYLLAAGVMFLTALLATVYQTSKAVLSNPVESLKYE